MQHYCIIPDTLKGTLPDNGIQAYTTHHPHHQASLSYDKATMYFEKRYLLDNFGNRNQKCKTLHKESQTPSINDSNGSK